MAYILTAYLYGNDIGVVCVGNGPLILGCGETKVQDFVAFVHPRFKAQLKALVRLVDAVSCCTWAQAFHSPFKIYKLCKTSFARQASQDRLRKTAPACRVGYKGVQSNASYASLRLQSDKTAGTSLREQRTQGSSVRQDCEDKSKRVKDASVKSPEEQEAWPI